MFHYTYIKPKNKTRLKTICRFVDRFPDLKAWSSSQADGRWHWKTPLFI
jgi:hypothetical protein